MKPNRTAKSTNAVSLRRLAVMKLNLGHSRGTSVTRKFFRNVPLIAWKKAFFTLFPEPNRIRPTDLEGK